MLEMKNILAANLTTLLDSRGDMSRLNLSKIMGVADGTLGRIKYGTGNPTIDVIEQIAKFFRIEVWQLFYPNLGRDMVRPDITSAERSWPFTTPREKFDLLPAPELAEINHVIEYKIAKWVIEDGERKEA